MRIFILPGWYKSKANPGSCLFIYEQAVALSKLGHQVVVLAVHQHPIQTLSALQSGIHKYDDGGILTYETEIYTFNPSRFTGIYIRSFEKALRRLMDEAKRDVGAPDVLYAHFSFAAGISAVMLKEDTPLVVEEHYSLLMGSVNRGVRRCVTDTVNSADAFICVSSGLKQAVLDLTGTDRELRVISNMIDPVFRYYPRPASEDFVFLGIGGLIPRKRFDLLIRAFADEFRDDGHIRLRIAGRGEEEGKLRALIASLDMESRIELLGQIDRAGTLDAYIHCDCFALPSAAETFGLVYREALAVGRPVISTKHGGFDEDSWHPEYGALIDIDDAAQLRRAMRNIVDSRDRCDPEKISELCLRECSEAAVAGQIEAALTQARDGYAAGGRRR